MKKFKSIFSVALLFCVLGVLIPSVQTKAATATDPQLGAVAKEVQVGEQIKAIDGNNGWWLIEERGKLVWCNAGPTSYWNGSSTGYPELLKVNQKMDVYEAQVVYNYKKGQAIEVISGSVTGWWKVKTPDGYQGWVNAGPTSYNSNGTLVAGGDIPAYFTARLAPTAKIKDIAKGEQIKAIDSISGWWLIAENGKLGWCNAGPTSYWDSNTSTMPIYLKAEANISVYEAGVDYVYSKGEKISVVEGTVPGWWKVKTPNGYYAWVDAGPTSYNNNGDLVANSSLKAYFTGKVPSVKTDAQRLVSIASGEVGYKETPTNITKYGSWYGFQDEWCAMFVSWCANQAGISTNVIPKHALCSAGANWFKDNGAWQSPSGYLPKIGDIIYFYRSGGINHIGIVESVSGGTVTTIEGNSSDMVKRNTYILSDPGIAGYGSPKYAK